MNNGRSKTIIGRSYTIVRFLIIMVVPILWSFFIILVVLILLVVFNYIGRSVE